MPLYSKYDTRQAKYCCNDCTGPWEYAPHACSCPCWDCALERLEMVYLGRRTEDDEDDESDMCRDCDAGKIPTAEEIAIRARQELITDNLDDLLHTQFWKTRLRDAKFGRLFRALYEKQMQAYMHQLRTLACVCSLCPALGGNLDLILMIAR
jgi:hypothetical protein